MTHHYKIGEKVSLSFGFHDQDAIGVYEIVAVLPTRVDGEPQYRIRGSDDRERVIGEAQIGAAGKTLSVRRPRRPDNPVTKELNRIRDKHN